MLNATSMLGYGLTLPPLPVTLAKYSTKVTRGQSTSIFNFKFASVPHLLMSKFSITTALARLEYTLRRGARRGESQMSMSAAFRAPNYEPLAVNHIIKPEKPPAHSPISILNDDVLLHIFYIYRLHIEDFSEGKRRIPTYPLWDRQRWWYKLAHVSRRWRRVILAAPSLLDLHLVCTHGVPVADMLAHSPRLPLTIFYWFDGATILKAKDEKGALLALSHRDRVRRIALSTERRQLERFVVAMDGDFPILEWLNIVSSTPGVTLPRTFGAPSLSDVELMHVRLPIECPVLTTTGLVSLRLTIIPGSGYFPPSYLLTSLSLMPQLETLYFSLEYHVPSPNDRDTASAAISHVTLPNLRDFEFRGLRAYLEGLCARMTAPVLSVFHAELNFQLTVAVPSLLSFIQTSENLQFNAVKLVTSNYYVKLLVQGVPQLRTRSYPFTFDLEILVRCPGPNLSLQISSAIQILDTLSPLLSVVERVTLMANRDDSSHSLHHVDRTQWRRLLRPFSNAKKLHVDTTLESLGHSLRTNDGEQPLELLPNLEEVIPLGKDDENALLPFVNEREAFGRPVRLTLRSK
jgi:F-box-like